MIMLFIFSLIYILLISFIYFSKEKIDNSDNRLYKIIIIVNVIGIIIDIIQYLFIKHEANPFLISIFNKLYLAFIITWITIFAHYVINRGDEHIKNKFKNILKIIYYIFMMGVFIFPTNYFYDGNNIIYSYGPGIQWVSGFIITDITIMLISMTLDLYVYKNYNKRKYIPLYIYVGLGLIVTIIQNMHPEILLTSSIITFITILVYFFIENPDVKMIEQLNSAKDQADKANRAKTDFLSSMSHEIRTPLNAIVGFSDCINNATSLEEAKENAKDVINASQTLLEIVNGILDISKIEAGKLEIVNSPYNAKRVFEDLAKLITPKMNEKALDFTYHIAPDLPETLYGDHANIKKVITNLLSNACKYTDKGSVHYEVSCFNVNGVCKLIVSVEDTGRGIKKENVDKLFTKFQRLEEDRNTTIEGTGLGLAITKQLIELMGGKIIVHTVYGEGSKFTVTFDQRIEEVKLVDHEKIVNTDLNLKDKKILLVDDNVLNIKVATKLLQRFHANDITAFENGLDCLTDIGNGSKYDVILLDDMMPKMSGVETLKKLKEIPNFNIPVVALTANAITGMKEKYLNEGFTNYLAKPIEKDELIQVLNEVLNTNQSNSTEQVETLEIFEYEEPYQETFGKDYLIQNGVNIDKAIELLGDIEMYNMTITDFVAELPNKWSNIEKYKDKNDMENYAIEVHSLKSDCKYLGFTTLADISYQHELKSKENDQEFVSSNFKKLEDEYKNVKRIATNYVENLNQNKNEII